jgi:cytochrome b561
MGVSVPDDRYSSVAIILHWLIAFLVLLLLGLGWYMADLPKGPDRSWYFALHKSLGLTVLMLMILRVAWRLSHTPPALPESLPLWRRQLAQGSHQLFYVLLFLQPLSGYVSSSFSGYKTKYFGFPLPHWGWKQPVLNDILTNLHVATSVVLVSLIVLHLAGALQHLFNREDKLFRRMLP